MDIRIHVTDGETFTFNQKNQVIAENILKSIRPNKMFTQPRIIIQDSISISVFACYRVEWIEFITKIDPGWLAPHGPKSLKLISEREYEERVALKELEIETRERPTPAEAALSMKVLLSFVMRSGQQLFAETTHFRSQYSPEPNGVYGKRNKDGHVLINPQNIIQWTVNCTFADTARNAWEANRVMSL